MVEINNLTTSRIDEQFLKRVAEKVLKEENKIGIGLSIALVGQGRIRALNKKYKKKNRTTDILAFPDGGLSARHSPTLEALAGGGEIVICLREVKKNAERFNSVFEKELVRVLIHGILHLLGYDHEKDEKEAAKMREKEEHYLFQLT